MEDNYKKKYYKLLRELNSITNRMVYERCPPFKQCCGGCLLLKELTKSEKKQNVKDNSRSNRPDE